MFLLRVYCIMFLSFVFMSLLTNYINRKHLMDEQVKNAMVILIMAMMPLLLYVVL